MIRAAWILIAERGLEGMSTREVLARTGAPRGSVYHHFPRGRTELVELALEHAQGWMHDQVVAINPGTPAEVIDGFLDIWRRILDATDYRAGCAAVGVIAGAQDPDLIARSAAAFNDAIAVLTDKFVLAGLSSTGAPGRATALVCAAEGAVLLARAQRSRRPLDDVADDLKAR